MYSSPVSGSLTAWPRKRARLCAESCAGSSEPSSVSLTVSLTTVALDMAGRVARAGSEREGGGTGRALVDGRRRLDSLPRLCSGRHQTRVTPSAGPAAQQRSSPAGLRGTGRPSSRGGGSAKGSEGGEGGVGGKRAPDNQGERGRAEKKMSALDWRWETRVDSWRVQIRRHARKLPGELLYSCTSRIAAPATTWSAGGAAGELGVPFAGGPPRVPAAVWAVSPLSICGRGLQLAASDYPFPAAAASGAV